MILKLLEGDTVHLLELHNPLFKNSLLLQMLPHEWLLILAELPKRISTGASGFWLRAKWLEAVARAFSMQ